MRIVAVLLYLPTLPIASGSLRRLELCRAWSKRHEVHLVCWHATQLDNPLVRAFWESQIDRTDRPLPHVLRDYEEALQPYRGIFGSISTLPQPGAGPQSPWQRLRRFLSVTPDAIRQDQEQCGAYEKMITLVRSRASDVKADLIWVGRMPMAQFAFNSGLPFIVDSPDANSLRELQRAGRCNSLWARYRRRMKAFGWRLFERQVLKRAAALVLNSESDADYLMRTGFPAANIWNIPNGVDTSYFKPDPRIPEEPDLLAFTGSFSYDFNTEAIAYFLKHIWPLIRRRRPQCRCLLIGPDPPESFKTYSAQDVAAVGYVPDLRPYLQRASLFISPLLGGTGMKNKVLVALAMAKAVVSTPPGCSGIKVTDGIEVSLADTPSDFSEKVVKLLENPAVRHKMGTLARKKVLSEYGWESRAETYESLLLSVARGTLSDPPDIASACLCRTR